MRIGLGTPLLFFSVAIDATHSEPGDTPAGPRVPDRFVGVCEEKVRDCGGKPCFDGEWTVTRRPE